MAGASEVAGQGQISYPWAQTEDVIVAAAGDDEGKIQATFTLPHEGLYFIGVKSAEAGETGTYELSLGVER